jgi:nucleoside phosphorylase
VPRSLASTELHEAFENLLQDARRELLLADPYLELGRRVLQQIWAADAAGVRTTLLFGPDVDLISRHGAEFEEMRHLCLFAGPVFHDRMYANERFLLVSSGGLTSDRASQHAEAGLLFETGEPAYTELRDRFERQLRDTFAFVPALSDSRAPESVPTLVETIIESGQPADRVLQMIAGMFEELRAQIGDIRQSLGKLSFTREPGSQGEMPSHQRIPAARPDVVLVTVNDHETEAVYTEFKAATATKAVPVSLEGRLYHNLGTVNGTTVYHALSEMGSGGAGGMQQTVEKAIRALDPAAVIAVGIAFGVNEDDQEIGDILLSKQLRPYDLQRQGEDIVLRDDKPSGSTWLLNHFKAFARSGWKGATVRPGVILSGDKLIDNIDYRGQLLKLESEAIGGEMEGAGLYVSSHEHKVDWIVVKAICDWADGNKSTYKTARQKEAAKNAAEFVRQAIEYAPLKRPTREGRGGSLSSANSAPNEEKIRLSAALESVNVKYVDPDVSISGARAELRARFRVTNSSNKTARVWNVRIEIVPSNPKMKPYFLEMQNKDSTEPILPRGSQVKNVEFAFRIMNSPVPLPFAFRSLLVSEIRFWTVSEDGEGAPQSVHISQVPDSDQLIPTIQTHLRNKLGWPV